MAGETQKEDGKDNDSSLLDSVSELGSYLAERNAGFDAYMATVWRKQDGAMHAGQYLESCLFVDTI